MRSLFLLMILTFVTKGYSQNDNTGISNKGNKMLSYEMNFIGLGMGAVNSELENTIIPQGEFILDNIRNRCVGLRLLEFRPLYKDRIGLTIDLGYSQSNLDEHLLLTFSPAKRGTMCPSTV